MVTSNKQTDKKVVTMAEHNSSSIVPQRTLLGEVNEHITCPLCRGYYIDATTIVECLHSFCRSCIIKHLQGKSYCPVCEMMINSAKPNIKLDKALQDIVYKLVPGLFEKEMERRQLFYASRPGQAANATPEQRGEDTERIIFSPEDVISFSLEYADATDTDSISSKSSDSNEPQNASATTRRYLQCPAVVNINHLKKFLSMKFDIDSTQFAIDILYKRVPLPDYYTLMDIAYIYNWKRNEPMRFFYQIIDYIAIRNRLFDINRKGSHYKDRKSSPAPTEDTNISSPTVNLNDQGSEISSGTDSPMPDDEAIKKANDLTKKNSKSPQQPKESNIQDNCNINNSKCPSPAKKTDDEAEKSQFLNSFELTAKSHSSTKSSPVKPIITENVLTEDTAPKVPNTSQKVEEPLKRKYNMPPNTPELKKLKIELEKTKIPNNIIPVGNNSTASPTISNQFKKVAEKASKVNEIEINKNSQNITKILSTPSVPTNDNKQEINTLKLQLPESSGVKRIVPSSQNISSPKRKPIISESPQSLPVLSGQKTLTPIKPQGPKLETQPSCSKSGDAVKTVKKIPDLKPGIPPLQTSQNKPSINKVRMDLLANNSDPTIDRSKIMSQVKSSLSTPSTTQTSGDPLKSLFDSCKINIPSSLSITLTDQKLDARNSGDLATPGEQKKPVLNKNLSTANNIITHKVPSPPVHNYIEILKLPDGDAKKQQNKIENTSDVKINTNNKSEPGILQSKSSKSSETSAKGPIPNLKPISDAKMTKQSGNFSTPITFQQTFEQQLQSLQSDKKSKLPKTKTQVPKLVPATSKAFNAVNKINPNNKPTMSNTSCVETKVGAALDLSTPHNVHSQLGPQQTKAFETMQSIANLAKKQNLPSKGPSTPVTQNNIYSNVTNRSSTTGDTSLRGTSSMLNQINIDKGIQSGSQANSPRQDNGIKMNTTKSTNSNPVTPPGYHMSNSTSTMPQPSPRSQTRSPSSSPKLVIAEDKQTGSCLESNINQSNQISSTQLSSLGVSKNDTPKCSPGTSKPNIKTVKPVIPPGKMTGIRQPIQPNMKPNPPMNPPDYLLQPQLITAQHALLRQQMEMQMQMFKARQYDLFKMSNMAHQSQNEFNNKDKH